MGRVDFYILAQAGEKARQQFSCRLTSKAVSLDHTVHIRTADDAQAREMDELLWTFDDAAFLPHDLWQEGAREAPITIASATIEPPADADVIINLADSALAGSTARVAEVLCADASVRAAGRQRFATYRDAGHEMDTHKL